MSNHKDSRPPPAGCDTQKFPAVAASTTVAATMATNIKDLY